MNKNNNNTLDQSLLVPLDGYISNNDYDILRNLINDSPLQNKVNSITINVTGPVKIHTIDGYSFTVTYDPLNREWLWCLVVNK